MIPAQLNAHFAILEKAVNNFESKAEDLNTFIDEHRNELLHRPLVRCLLWANRTVHSLWRSFMKRLSVWLMTGSCAQSVVSLRQGNVPKFGQPLFKLLTLQRWNSFQRYIGPCPPATRSLCTRLERFVSFFPWPRTQLLKSDERACIVSLVNSSLSCWFRPTEPQASCSLPSCNR